MTEWLVADIGGTHSRLALAGVDGITAVRVFDNAGYDGLEPILENYLGDLDESSRPHAAALAVASPVRGDRVRMTNLGWGFSAAELQRQFGFESCRILNDFAAAALAIPRLEPADIRVIAEGEELAGTPVGLIGPGTGLGVAALVPCGQDWIAVAGEGGHVTLAPVTPEEDRIVGQLRRQFGHVSAERLLSGPGLSLLYRVLAEDGNTVMKPEAVTALAVAGEDAVAVKALDCFLAMLGTVAGNLALTLGAQGGIYLGGGILPEIADYLEDSLFRQRFVDKGRYRDYLEAVPVRLILHPCPALPGLVAAITRDV